MTKYNILRYGQLTSLSFLGFTVSATLVFVFEPHSHRYRGRCNKNAPITTMRATATEECSIAKLNGKRRALDRVTKGVTELEVHDTGTEVRGRGGS